MLVKLLSNKLQQEFPRPTFWLEPAIIAAVYIYTCSSCLPYKAKKQIQLAIPQYPLLYGSLFSIFVLFRNHFDVLSFEFEIDHDNGTVTGVLSHSEATKEQCNKNNDLSTINIGQTAVSLLFLFVVSFDLFCSQKRSNFLEFRNNNNNNNITAKNAVL